ncbi:10709_t:CDS:2, partial [Cetraspora pellucida]
NLLNFDNIFNINEDKEVDMNETVDNDPEKTLITKKAKTYYFLVNIYENWIKNLEK